MENHLKNFPDLPGGICFQNKLDQIEDSGETSQPVDFEWDLSTYYEQINVKSYFKYGGLGAFSKFVEHFSGEKRFCGAFLTVGGPGDVYSNLACAQQHTSRPQPSGSLFPGVPFSLSRDPDLTPFLVASGSTQLRSVCRSQ